MKLFWTPVLLLVIGFSGCKSNTSPQKIKEVNAPVEEEVVVNLLEDLSSSTDIKKLLGQNWEHKEDAEDAEAAGSGSSIEMPYRGLALCTDGELAENPRGNIRVGKWSYDESKKTVHFRFTKGDQATYRIGAIGPLQLILLNLADNQTTIYRADGHASLEPALNPFHPANNLWRLKPARRESDSALKLRTERVVDFYAKFFADNAARNGNIISFVGLPSCFKWYRGGISVIGPNKLEEKWISCFYNKEQAIEAQQLLEGIISKKYKWKKQEANWVKQSADVLRQMRDTLNRL